MLFGQKKTTMVAREDALPGRTATMPTADRHVVLGTPLTGPWPEGMEVLYVAMGCFWGAERIYWEVPGVYSTAAGYMAGFTPNPSYEEVCSGRTGHTEAVRVVYDPQRIEVDTLLKAFWENHDPTQGMRQGNDVGTQYRSGIYPTTGAQRVAAEESQLRYQRALDEAGFGTITTEIIDAADAGAFFYAEDHHQGYLHKNPNGYCNHGFCQVAYSTEAHQPAAGVELPNA